MRVRLLRLRSSFTQSSNRLASFDRITSHRSTDRRPIYCGRRPLSDGPTTAEITRRRIGQLRELIDQFSTGRDQYYAAGMRRRLGNKVLTTPKDSGSQAHPSHRKNRLM